MLFFRGGKTPGRVQDEMNLYLVSQNVVKGYESFVAMVVCCRNENAARMTHPSIKDWNGLAYNGWCNAIDVDIQFLGVADPLVKVGVICKSFNAG